MPNGYSRWRTRAAPKRTTAARTRTAAQTKGRAAAVAKARPKPKPTARSNRRMGLANKRAIEKLKKDVLGPIQRQVSTFDSGAGYHVLANSPFLFQVNDPGYGNGGPRMYHLDGLGSPATFNTFSLYTDVGYNQEDATHVFNNEVFLVGVDLQFEFSGFLDNTHVRVDIIRQKKYCPAFWSQQSGANYLPQTLDNLKQIAGFSPHEINRSMFEVMHTRKLYFNSKGSANAADLVQDRNTSDPTTAPIKHCHIYVPFKKMLKLVGDHGQEALGNVMSSSLHKYEWNNTNPLANVWCLISSDDLTGAASAVTGDAVSCKIIRKCIWRDAVD